MNMSVETEFLLQAHAAGIWGAFFYDGIRIFRRVFAHKRFWISAEDFIFWMIIALKGFQIMYENDTGGLRWFAILGGSLGVYLYKKTISRFYVIKVSALLVMARNKLTAILKLFRINLSKR